jgi:probable rRNA maturation factor
MPRRGAKSAVAISSTQKCLRVPRKAIARLVSFVAAAEGAKLAQIDIAVVDRREIVSLNRRWLDRAGPTDVLCFDLSGPEQPGISAELVICGDVAAEQGRLRGTGGQRELMLYVVHGLLHLMGYDDQSIRSAAKMHAREEELLKKVLTGKRGRSRRAGR